jgi:polysaccharide export outer membrane protein
MYLIKPNWQVISLVFLLFIASSCNTYERLVYFGGVQNTSSTVKSNDYLTRIKVDDQLYIFVSSNNIELSANYNLPNFSVASSNMQQGSTQGNPVLGYLVEQDSSVTLPKIGKIKAAGLTIDELETLIAKSLSGLLKDPIVHARIINFKITILGDVKNPGTFNVPYNKINYLQALGLAGDLNITGNRSNVLLIRTIGNNTITKRLNLIDSNLIKTDFCWLQNGDVLYVEPNVQKRNSSNTLYQSWPLIVSTTTLIILMLNNFKK